MESFKYLRAIILLKECKKELEKGPKLENYSKISRNIQLIELLGFKIKSIKDLKIILTEIT